MVYSMLFIFWYKKRLKTIPTHLKQYLAIQGSIYSKGGSGKNLVNKKFLESKKVFFKWWKFFPGKCLLYTIALKPCKCYGVFDLLDFQKRKTSCIYFLENVKDSTCKGYVLCGIVVVLSKKIFTIKSMINHNIKIYYITFSESVKGDRQPPAVCGYG